MSSVSGGNGYAFSSGGGHAYSSGGADGGAGGDGQDGGSYSYSYSGPGGYSYSYSSSGPDGVAGSGRPTTRTIDLSRVTSVVQQPISWCTSGQVARPKRRSQWMTT